MDKKVEFYTVELIKRDDMIASMSDVNISQRILQSEYVENEYFDDNENPKVVISCVEATENYLFGIIGKLEDLNSSILTRIREKELTTIVDVSSDFNYYLEKYTYFYFNFSKLKCAVLSNVNAPRFRNHFSKYLHAIMKNSFIEKISVTGIIDSKIFDKIGRFQTMNKLKYKFDEDSPISEDLMGASLTKIFNISQSSIREASVDINLKVDSVTQKTKSILSDEEFIHDNFTKFEIDATLDDNKNCLIDLIHHILLKKITLNIDDRCFINKDDLDKIKEALANSFES